MIAIASSVSAPRKFSMTPLLAGAVLLQLAHLLVVVLLPHPLLASNIFQLLLPLLLVVVSLHQRVGATNAVGRRCWLALAASFGLWALGQALFIYFLYVPPHKSSTVRVDDFLWLLYGLPLLLAIYTTHDEVDHVGMLDRAQAILFIAVLYLAVLMPSVHLSLSNAYLIQNVALLLCCLLRLPVCMLLRERRFFARLAVFLLFYGVLTVTGTALYAHGWNAGSAVDLVWTLPMTLLLVLILRDAQEVANPSAGASRLLTAVRSMQGLSVAALTFLSIGMSALIAAHSPVLGGAFVVITFSLFALRTNGRERAWHHAHGRLEDAVLQDALTGLGNRILLRNRLGERLSQPSAGHAVLLFADLDRFKNINDSLGHDLGDRLLIEVGDRLRTAAPQDSVVCRLGGDEFVVLTSAESPEEAQASGVTLLAALHLPFRLGDHVLRCTASIGVVQALAGQGADDLLRTADHAMYRAKQLGKDRVQLFDASLLAHISSRWQMEADLRDSVEAGAIEVVFQPILSVEGGEITGFEALARWSHSQHGNVPPSDFIPLAEDAGIIRALGAQVLEKACRQVAEWNLLWEKSLSVSVNVSPREFADAGLLSTILATLQQTGLPPSLLRLEITESALLVHAETVRHTLSEARAHGIRISLDDFGTGYSSLSFLLSLPVDEVKVDRSFVSDMQSDPQRKELVRTVVHLGHSLGKRVVAEGVETERDLEELARMGCECAQGWLISRPLSPSNMEASLPEIVARSARTASQSHRGASTAVTAKTRPMAENWREMLKVETVVIESSPEATVPLPSPEMR